MKNNLGKIILVGLASEKLDDFLSKIEDAVNLGLKETSLFLEFFDKTAREKIYASLSKSKIENIPLVHIRHDMKKDELEFLEKKYKTKYFTLHEEFITPPQWKERIDSIFSETLEKVREEAKALKKSLK